MKLIPSLHLRIPWNALGLRGLILFAGMAAVAGMVQPKPIEGQEQPRPTQRVTSSFNVVTTPGQYDLVEQILDFPPGAATRLHYHSGQAFVTVLEGQVVRREGTVETLYGLGQTFIESPTVFHTVTNRGSVKARVFASFLLAPGALQTINHPDAPAPAVTPTATFFARRTLNTQPGELTLTQAVVDFAPGAYQPLHHHGGQGLVVVIEGEIAFTTAAGEMRLRPGGVFADVGAHHDARNLSAGTSTTVVTFLIRKGEPQTTFLSASTPTSPTAASAPAIRPPSTGDGGLVAR